MRTNSKRFSFTLIEMLIVIALITLSLGVVGISIPKAIKKERFEKAVSHLISKISLAQELSIDYQMDLSLILEEQKKGITATIWPAVETSEQFKKTVNRHIEIEGIQEFVFNEKPVKKLELKFEGKTGSSSRGTLELRAKGNQTSLALKGYPGKLPRGTYEEIKIQASYPEEILSAL